MGQSLIHGMPVNRLISERYWLTVTISFASLLFVFAVAVPGDALSTMIQQMRASTFSADDIRYLEQQSVRSQRLRVHGVRLHRWLATPNFLLALLLQFVIYRWTNWSVGGLFSPEYALASWSFGKVVDLFKHLPLPLIVIGSAGTAGMIRVLRATLLDELPKQYVVTARTKGVAENRLLFKYPVRIAVNPIVSGIGGVLPTLVSGEAITAMVLSLPTIGPLLLNALLGQDMYLAGSIVMLVSALGLIGTLLSDLLLVMVDPRIKFEERADV